MWNVVTGRRPGQGISDYDVFYFDTAPRTSPRTRGVRPEPGGEWRVYAPHGLSDVFNLVVHPNPVLAPREVYEAKAARWKEEWPQLTVLPWPT